MTGCGLSGWLAGLNGAVCLGLGSGCQQLQFFPQQARWGCEGPDTILPHQVCHLGWLSRHSWGQRASLSPSHPSRGFLGFLAAHQTHNSGLPQRESYERQEGEAAWVQKPVQHHFCHLLLVKAARGRPRPDSKGQITQNHHRSMSSTCFSSKALFSPFHELCTPSTPSPVTCQTPAHSGSSNSSPKPKKIPPGHQSVICSLLSRGGTCLHASSQDPPQTQRQEPLGRGGARESVFNHLPG